MGVHALLSPSGMPAAIRCLAKPRRERGLPEQSSSYADEGTAAHFLLEQCLLQNVDAEHFIGLRIRVENGVTEFHTSGQYPVGPDMISDMQKAIDYIRAVADGATIYAEQKLSIAHITGEHWHKETGEVCFKNPDSKYAVGIDAGAIYSEDEVEPATGTTDVWVMKGKVAHSIDLKWGMGVQVYAADNEQQEMYADAGLLEFDFLGEVEEIHLHILQPRLKHYDEHVLTRAELDKKIEAIRKACQRIVAGPADKLPAVPGDKQCRFCKASATCPERTAFTVETIVGEFVDLSKGEIEVSIAETEKILANAFGVKPKFVDYNGSSDGYSSFTVKKPSIRPALEAATERLTTAEDERLATLMDAADMIEGFAKAVRAEVERRLLAGKFTDARYKLVEGRMGNREFEDEEVAEAEMKAMRLKVDEMYNKKLISAPQAEKLLKESNPRKWAKLQKLIVQRQGKPSVAPASDKRPALNLAIAEQFEELPAEAEEFKSGASMIVEALAEVEQTVVEDNFEDLV